MLHDAHDLLQLIKTAAINAVEASQPSDFCFGKVTSMNPLKVAVEQKLTLGEAQLVLTKGVTDHTITVTDSELGMRRMTIHAALQVGEKVVLMKQKGGQKYLILDRVVAT